MVLDCKEDIQRARRAAASGTKSLIVTAAASGAACLGLLFPAGIPIAAAIAAEAGIVGGASAVASVAGTSAEMAINDKIQEPFQTDTGNFRDFSGKKFATIVAIDSVAGVVTGALGPASRLAGAAASSALSNVDDIARLLLRMGITSSVAGIPGGTARIVLQQTSSGGITYQKYTEEISDAVDDTQLGDSSQPIGFLPTMSLQFDGKNIEVMIPKHLASTFLEQDDLEKFFVEKWETEPKEKTPVE